MDDFVDPNPARRSSTARALPALAFLLLLAAVWADPLFSRRNFAGRDLLAYNLPLEKAIHDAYSRGHFPVWVSEISGGRPLLPNPNAGAMYPVRILLSRLPFPAAVKVFPVLHWAAAGIGMLVLLHALGRSRAAGWIAAVTYVFSGVVVSDVFFPHVLAGMAMLPWIVWIVARPSSFAFQTVVLSVFLALDVFAGDVFTTGIAILACLAWIVSAAASADRKRLVLVLATATGLAALAGLPQILATLLWVPETNRAVSGITWREALQYSISPYRLLELVIPYPFGAIWTADRTAIWGWRIHSGQMMGLFLTLYAGALAPIALIASWRVRLPVARFARLLVGVSLLLAVPPSLLPDAWGSRLAPIALRNPEKFAVLLAFGLALLSAAGYEVLRASSRLPRWILAAGAALCGIAILAAAAPGAAARLAIAFTRSRPDLVEVASRDLPRALAEGALLWMATCVALELSRSPRRAIAIAGLALLTAVPVLATRRIGWTFREDEVFAPPTFARFLQRHDPEGRYRTLGELIFRPVGALEVSESGSDVGLTDVARRSWALHTQVLWHRGTVFNADFDNGDLSRVQSLRRISGMAEGFPDPASFFGSFSLRWGTRYRDRTPVAGYSRVGGAGLDDWDENPKALPDIRLAARWREEPGAVDAFHRIPALREDEIVVETGRSAQGAAPAGDVTVRERTPERLVLDVRTPAPTWLFVLRGFWTHRSVRLDGREVEVFPAQLAFSAVAVPAGSHRIEWEEELPGWGVSRFGPLLYGAAIVALFAWDRLCTSRAMPLS